MKIYVIKHEYDNGEQYEDYRSYESYNMFSTLENAEKTFYKYTMDEYEGQYSLIEWTLDTQERILLETSPWVPCTSLSSYYYDTDEEDYYNCLERKDYENMYNPLYNEDLAYERLYNRYHNGDAPSHDEVWEQYEIEKLDKDLTHRILDSYADEFCKEFNEAKGINLIESLVIAKYNKIFDSMGYSKAWTKYIKELEIL